MSVAPLLATGPSAAPAGSPVPEDRPARPGAAAGPGRSQYIVSGWYDWVFFLLQPMLALGLGIAVSGTRFGAGSFESNDAVSTPMAVALGILIHAHLVAVFFRSHANPSMFRLHPIRFVIVPVVVWLAIVADPWVAVSAAVLGTFWDVWHSGLQTFGLGRIYDRNRGNPPDAGRRLDYWINHLLYAGPILAGATMLDHFDRFNEFEDVGAYLLTTIPARMEARQPIITLVVLVGGSLFVAYYLFAYARMARRGHQVSWPKVFLLGTTGVCSVVTWGFNTWGEAFLIMNTFHAVQYLALVWAKEGNRITALFRMSPGRLGSALTLGLFLTVLAAYGVGARLIARDFDVLWAITATVALMHFWYDGFVWSVRKAQV